MNDLEDMTNMEVMIRHYNINEQNKILNMEIQCLAPLENAIGKRRLSLVFEAPSSGKRYFPVTVRYQKTMGDRRYYFAVLSIELSSVFFQKFPKAKEKVQMYAAFCEAENLWNRTDTLLELSGILFQKEVIRKSAVQQTVSAFLYGICTILLPLWLLDGLLAQKGLHGLHPAARGRTGLRAVFYHAHGLVKDWTGYGYSVREYKTQYFKRCYDCACRQVSKTNDILFLSERRVEKGGNLDRIRSEAERAGYSYEEFLTETPIHKLTPKEIRRCAYMVAAARLIILEDFVPQLHALDIRCDTEILQMWHACGAFKLFGLSELGIVDHLEQSTRNHRSYTAALASSRGVVPFYSEAFGIDERAVKAVGVPRTDIFFDRDYAGVTRERLFDKYPVCRDKKVVLFAPTFRGSGNKTAYYPWEKFPVEQIMDVLPEDVVLIIKNHPFVHRKCEIPSKYRERILDLSGGENINDLLFITSLLITDYSSVIFEAVLLELPILFYAFDLQEYLEQRDLYFDFASFAPGKIVGDMEGLEHGIKELLEGKQEEKNEAGMTKEQFRKLFLDALDGHSTERTMKLVQQMLGL